MKIQRDGKEYELTDSELFKAFKEYQYLTDVDDVQENLDNELSEDELEQIAGNEKFISEVAIELRKNIDDFNMSFSLALANAVDDVKSDYV
ncbi:MAG: hypothetical protein OSJ43_06650 [Oscillospiraceae bacterium]|nr:hypothetical protein [Oscillospiraceae bacterium]